MIYLADFISFDAIFAAVVTVGLAFCGIAFKLISRSSSNAEGIKRIEDKLEEVNLSNMKSQLDELWLDRRETWQYLRQRGDAEAIGKGLVVRNSPLTIEGTPTEELIEQLYQPYIPDLLEIAQEVQGSHESILFEAIAKRLGERLLKEVCPVLHTDQGGCISLAIAILNKHKKKNERQC